MHAILFNFYGYKLRITHETFHAYLQSWSALIRDLVHAVDNRKSNGLPSKLPVKCQISNLECTQLLMQNSRMLKKNSAMTIILKIISWRKYLPRNRKLTCSSKNSVISGVIVTWTKLHPLKQSNVWKKKTRIFRSVSDNSLSFDCEISEKRWSFIKSIMLGSWTVCCDVTGGTKAVLHSEPARCQRTTVRKKK